MSNGKGRERAIAERARRELDAWPEGPAGGFEPLGEVIKRIINNSQRTHGRFEMWRQHQCPE